MVNKSVETAKNEWNNATSRRKRTLDFDDVMNHAVERLVLTLSQRSHRLRKKPAQAHHEGDRRSGAGKVKEYLDVDEPNYTGFIHWVNTTFRSV